MISLQNTTPLGRLMMLGHLAGGIKTDEVTTFGNPITFQTDLVRPLKSLLIPFTPQQEGTGDPSPSNVRNIVPWNGLTVFGGGKNLFNKDDPNVQLDKRIATGGTIINSQYGQAVTGFIPVKAGAKYIINNYINANYFSCFYSEKDITKPVGSIFGNNEYPKVAPSGAKYLIVTIGNVGINTFQLEDGQTATTYEPYVPITETDIVFPPLTNNLFSAEIEQGEYNYTYGYKQDSTTRIRSDYVPLKAGKYTISCTGMNDVVMYVFDTNKRFLVGESQRIWKKTTFTFTISDDRLVAFVWRKTGDVEITPSNISNVMLNTGETAKPYEPYTNSVYGGTLDAVTGVLTVTHSAITKNTANMDNSESYPGWKDSGIANLVGTGINDTIRNCITNVSPIANYSVGVNTNAFDIVFMNMDYFHLTQTEWIALAIDVQIVVPLATPQEIQLTPQQITALVGNNTLWSDADHGMTAVYLKKR